MGYAILCAAFCTGFFDKTEEQDQTAKYKQDNKGMQVIVVIKGTKSRT